MVDVYQSPISDLPQVINHSLQYQRNQNFYPLLYIFLQLSSQVVWQIICGEGHWHCFAQNPLDQADEALDLEGG